MQELTVTAMRCARAGDTFGEGEAYCKLGVAYFSLGQFDKAAELNRKYLNIALEVGDRAGEGKAYCNLGNAYCNLGQFANWPKELYSLPILQYALPSPALSPTSSVIFRHFRWNSTALSIKPSSSIKRP